MRYIRPPESLVTQLDVYTEEKFEDEEDIREQARTLMRNIAGENHERHRSDSEVALGDLIRLAKQHGELYPMMMEILKHYEILLQRDVGMYVSGISYLQSQRLMMNFQKHEGRLVCHLGQICSASYSFK